ncbi:hypothetical protein LTR56_026822 [Elasticomyces elasticus]|nr:hypothetical protein LTR56_026822 [Elasticomyces elasticus]KAK5727824.1 hypothetical protein LTS12_027409 [Elasticomyces elasticus]
MAMFHQAPMDFSGHPACDSNINAMSSVSDWTGQVNSMSTAQMVATEPAPPLSRTSPTPKCTLRSSPKRSLSPSDPESNRHKRQRNTQAARRYRQRKVDRVAELEEALTLVTKEKDELKLKLAKAETEASVLRGLVGGGRGG